MSIDVSNASEDRTASPAPDSRQHANARKTSLLLTPIVLKVSNKSNYLFPTDRADDVVCRCGEGVGALHKA